MRIYVLTKAYDYEGESFRGAFSTVEQAQWAIERAEANGEKCQDWIIYKVALDSNEKPEPLCTIAAK